MRIGFDHQNAQVNAGIKADGDLFSGMFSENRSVGYTRSFRRLSDSWRHLIFGWHCQNLRESLPLKALQSGESSGGPHLRQGLWRAFWGQRHRQAVYALWCTTGFFRQNETRKGEQEMLFVPGKAAKELGAFEFT